MLDSENTSYADVASTDDIDKYLDIFRGSGIGRILDSQVKQLITTNIDMAFSSLGNFLDYLISHHKNQNSKTEIKDDVIYEEIKSLVETMIKNPEYDEYKEYLQTKVDELNAAIKK